MSGGQGVLNRLHIGRHETSARDSRPGRRRRRIPWVAFAILVLIVGSAVLASLLTPYGPNTIDVLNRLDPPTWFKGGHILGTDDLGRDVLSRIIYGGRATLIVAVAALAVGGGFGLVMGVLAGYLGGFVGAVIMRVIDGFLTIPLMLIAIVLSLSLGQSLGTVVIATSITLWARFARVIRGEVLEIKNKEFVLQARVSGVSRTRIMLVHIVPNVMNTFIVLITLNLSLAILIGASLSFLGVGVPPPTASWGAMVAEGQDYMTTAWWVSLFPGIALVLCVLSVNIIGDWLRDLLDPRLKQI
jgi:peptide/nickel transport system permease protein